MKRELTISYNWSRGDGKPFKEYEPYLEESALERIVEMMENGCTSGELHDNITINDKESEVEFSGWWGLEF